MHLVDEMEHLDNRILFAFAQTLDKVITASSVLASLCLRLPLRFGKLPYLFDSLNDLLGSEDASDAPALDDCVESVFDACHLLEPLYALARQVSSEQLLDLVGRVVDELLDEYCLVVLDVLKRIPHASDQLPEHHLLL